VRAAVKSDAIAPSERRSHSAETNDAELIARIAAGNLAALGAVYDRYHAPVRAFVIRAAAGSPDVDDIVQEAFLTLLKAAKTYDGRASARPFLIGIAAQLVRRRRRAFTRWARTLSLLATSVVRTEDHDPERVTDVTEDLEHMQRALGRLSEDKRVVLLMIDGEGLSGLEVAEALGIPVATVRTRLHYARAEVRQRLAKRRSR